MTAPWVARPETIDYSIIQIAKLELLVVGFRNLAAAGRQEGIAEQQIHDLQYSEVMP